jgi:hypothetical protein
MQRCTTATERRVFERRLVQLLCGTTGSLKPHHVLLDVPTPRTGDELNGLYMQEMGMDKPINLVDEHSPSMVSQFGKAFVNNAKKVRVLVHPDSAEELKQIGTERLADLMRKAIALSPTRKNPAA